MSWTKHISMISLLDVISTVINKSVWKKLMNVKSIYKTNIEDNIAVHNSEISNVHIQNYQIVHFVLKLKIVSISNFICMNGEPNTTLMTTGSSTYVITN
jgi:hypothetical protein